MWPLPKLKNEIITLSLSPTELALAWITKEKKRNKPALKALKKIPITNCAFENNVVFNPTFLYSHVADFLTYHSLHNAFITCALSGPTIFENIVAFTTTTPTPGDLNLENSHKKIWNTHYLYPTENAQFQFYVAGIPRELLFQYQLFTQSVSLNVLTITTPFAAQLQTYQHIHNNAVRQEQLAYDMKQYNNDLSKTLTTNSLEQLVRIDSANYYIDEKKDMPLLHTLAGLYFAEKLSD